MMTRFVISLSTLLQWLLFLASPYLGVNGRTVVQDGNLSLLVAVPLTRDGDVEIDPGFFHLAAAILAMDHFNARDATVVPGLADLVHNCSIKIGNLTAVDTEIDSHNAMTTVVSNLLQTGKPPDAIAGPFNEIPALELSVLATGIQSPVVSHRAFDQNLLDPGRHPYFSQVSADFYSEMNFVGSYLQHVNRTNFITVLYAATAAITQKVDILRVSLEEKGFDQVKTYSFAPQEAAKKRASNIDTSQILSATGENRRPERSIRTALERIKETGYRTILLLPDNTIYDTPSVGAVAKELEMDQGQYAWYTIGGDDRVPAKEVLELIKNYQRMNASFLAGSGFLLPYDGYEKNPRVHLRDFMRLQNRSLLDQVQSINPKRDSYEQEFERLQLRHDDPNPFKTLADGLGTWMRGMAFMYDSVMAIGIGACEAEQMQRNKSDATTAISGEDLRDGIRRATFVGTTGPISFGNNAGNPGARNGSTVPFACSNFDPANQPEGFLLSEAWSPFEGKWIFHNQFVFGKNTTTPPPLRAQPEQNYLDPGIRLLGLALFVVALICVLLASTWLHRERKHEVVLAAQPIFMYVVCFGSFMVCPCILLSAFDESNGWSEERLDNSCIAWSWLDTLGHQIVYSALFTKLWRANRCLRFKTNQIELWRLLWPCTLINVGVIIILSLWTAKSGYGWDRKVVDDVTGESIGHCGGGSDQSYYMGFMYALHFTPMILAGIMAFKTTGVDDLYSDSKWVLTFILVQTQVLLVGAPVVALLNEVNPTARFLGLSLITFTFPVSSTGLIILPKALLVRKMRRNSRIRASEEFGATQRGEPTTQEEEGSSADVTQFSNEQPGGRSSQQTDLPKASRIQVVTFD